jgi:hypothetical protein
VWLLSVGRRPFPLRSSVYLLYWYKSADTDVMLAEQSSCRMRTPSRSITSNVAPSISLSACGPKAR